MDNFGEFLKTERENKGIRLEEIASITKIHIHSLQLLEENRLDELPPEPFLRGFIVAYAKYIGLDPDKAISKLHEFRGAPAEPTQTLDRLPTDARPKEGEERSPSEIIETSKAFTPWKIVSAVGFVFVLSAVIALTYFGKQQTEMANEPTPPPQTQLAGAPESPKATPPESSPTERSKVPASDTSNTAKLSTETQPPTASNVAHRIMIQGDQRTWMKVVVDDNPPRELFLGEGATAYYEAQSKIKLLLGNSATTKVFHNGSPAKAVYNRGSVKSFVFPANAIFPQDFRKPAQEEREVKPAESKEEEIDNVIRPENTQRSSSSPSPTESNR